VKLTNALMLIVASVGSLVCSCAAPDKPPQAGPEKLAVPERPPEPPAPGAAEKKAPAIEEPPAPEEPVSPATKPRQPVEPRAATRPAEAPPPPPRVIITVGELSIMSDRMDKALARMPKNTPPDKLAARRKHLYRSWIQEALFNAWLDEVEVTDEEIQAEREKLIGALVEREMRDEYMRERAEARRQARSARQPANTQPTTSTAPAGQTQPAPVKMPPPPTREQIEARKTEVLGSPKKVAEMLQTYMKRRNFSEEAMMRRFKLNVVVGRDSSPEKVDAFIQSHPVSFFDGTTVTASHILIATNFYDPPEVMEAARKKATQIAEEIKNGTISFEEAAKQHSDCPSAARGGDLRTFPLHQMVTPFALTADSLKVGEMSDPVETFFGWHIIKVTARKDGDGQVGDNAKRIVPRILKGITLRGLLKESLKDNPVTIHE